MPLDFVITMLLSFVSAKHFPSVMHKNGGAKLGTGVSQRFDNDGDHDHDDDNGDDDNHHYHH